MRRVSISPRYHIFFQRSVSQNEPNCFFDIYSIKYICTGILVWEVGFICLFILFCVYVCVVLFFCFFVFLKADHESLISSNKYINCFSNNKNDLRIARSFHTSYRIKLKNARKKVDKNEI